METRSQAISVGPPFAVSSEAILDHFSDQLNSLEVPPIIGSLHTAGIIPLEVKSELNEAKEPVWKRVVLIDYLKTQELEVLEAFGHHLKTTSGPSQAAVPIHHHLGDLILNYISNATGRKRPPAGNGCGHNGGGANKDGCGHNGGEVFKDGHGHIGGGAYMKGNGPHDYQAVCNHSNNIIIDGYYSRTPHYQSYPSDYCTNNEGKNYYSSFHVSTPPFISNQSDNQLLPPSNESGVNGPLADPPPKRLKLCETDNIGLHSEADSCTVGLPDPVYKGKLPHPAGKSPYTGITEPISITTTPDNYHSKTTYKSSDGCASTLIKVHPSSCCKNETTDVELIPLSPMPSASTSHSLLQEQGQSKLHQGSDDEEDDPITAEIFMLMGKAHYLCSSNEDRSDLLPLSLLQNIHNIQTRPPRSQDVSTSNAHYVSSSISYVGVPSGHSVPITLPHTKHPSPSPDTTLPHTQHPSPGTTIPHTQHPSPGTTIPHTQQCLVPSLPLSRVRPTRILRSKKTRCFMLQMRKLRTSASNEAMTMARKLLRNNILPLDLRLTGIQAVLPSSSEAIPILKKCLLWCDSSQCENPLFHKCNLHYRLVWCQKRVKNMAAAKEHASEGVHYGRQIEGDLGPVQAESYYARLEYQINKDKLSEDKLKELDTQHERALVMSSSSSCQEFLVRTVLEAAMFKMKMADYYLSREQNTMAGEKLSAANRILDNMQNARKYFEYADWAYYYQIRCHGYINSGDRQKAIEFGNKSIRYHTKCGRHGDADEVTNLLSSINTQTSNS